MLPETTRRERDALGEVELPAGVLFGVHTWRAVRHLSFSGRPLGSCPPLLRALAQVKCATARANARTGLLEPHLAAAIDTAAQAVIDGQWPEQFPADLLGGGGAIGLHMNVNEVLANLANESLGGRRGLYAPVQPKQHVGMSQSTADVCHTAARLAILASSAAVHVSLRRSVATLHAKAQAFATLPTRARTCLQDAMPTPLGTLFGGYVAQLRRRDSELQASLQRLHAVSLGGTVIGTGDGAPPAYRAIVVGELAAVTGLPLVGRDELPDAMQSCDDLRSVSAQLAQLAEACIKICLDLRLLGSGPKAGFGEILLPHVLEGSSFFGNKRNPVVPETMLQCCFQVLGCDRSVQAASAHGELYLNVFDTLAAVNVLDALHMMAAALTGFEADALRGLQADEARCRDLAGA